MRKTTGHHPRKPRSIFYDIRVIESIIMEQNTIEIQPGLIDIDCEHCTKPIINDFDFSTRLIIKLYHNIGLPRHYHLKCYIKDVNFIKFHIPTQTSDIKGYDKLKLYNKYRVLNFLLPHHISIPLRYQFKIIKYNLNELTDLELKICLQQRDLECYDMSKKWKSPVFTRTLSLKLLSKYLDSSKCQIKHEELVFGFCNQMQNELIFCIPTVINKLVLQYCALYIL